jgi:pimeloyl-ACP methyl ester carboxylesterase
MPRNRLEVFQSHGYRGLQDGIQYPLTPGPRITSTQSLAPSTINDDGRRRLLLVCIHGFIGNDNSFYYFPVDVHRCLRDRLAATHVNYSKIYPRYKTYKAFHIAPDNFSQWLALHESPNSDVILIGHSMGGLVAADVVLMVTVTTFVNLRADSRQ